MTEDRNTLEINSKGSTEAVEGLNDIIDTFINSLYKATIKNDSYHIKKGIPEDDNFKNFIGICEKLVYKYANNIKLNYDWKLLDAENEYSNIYLYITEALHRFYKSHCNSDIELFNAYIEDSNKTYINTNNKEYTFSEYMHMTVNRMIKVENLGHEKGIEKNNLKRNKYARVELDATTETDEGKEIDIELYSLGIYDTLENTDIKAYEETRKANKKELQRVQDKLLTALTRKQTEFIMVMTYGCYYKDDKDEIIINRTYTKQQKNQYFNQIQKRIGRDIRPFFIKKQYEEYQEQQIENKKKNKKVLTGATKRDTREYVNTNTHLIPKGKIKI